MFCRSPLQGTDGPGQGWEHACATQVPLRCDWCLQRPAAPGGLQRCSRSQLARYCCREHQQAAWVAPGGYKHECAALVASAGTAAATTSTPLAAGTMESKANGSGKPSLTIQQQQKQASSRVPTATMRLAARAVWRAQWCEPVKCHVKILVCRSHGTTFCSPIVLWFVLHCIPNGWAIGSQSLVGS
jgi:hypothetical protein